MHADIFPVGAVEYLLQYLGIVGTLAGVDVTVELCSALACNNSFNPHLFLPLPYVGLTD